MSSYSSINTYMRCPKKFDYAYRQNLQAKRIPKGMKQGSIAHFMLQEQYLSGTDPEVTGERILNGETPITLGLDNQEEFEAMVDMGVVIVRGHMDHYSDSWELLHVEEQFEVELDGHYVSVTPDLIAREPGQEEVWIVDHKSTVSLPGEYERPLPSTQDLAYGVVVSNFYPVAGFIYNWLRKKVPATPQISVKGDKINRIGNIDTTYEVLRDFVMNEAPQFMDNILVRTRLAQLRDTNNFYRRQEMRFTAAALDTATEELVDWILKIQENQYQLWPRAYLSTGIYGCERCVFNDICYTELNGNDSSLLRAEFYEPRKPKNVYEEKDKP